jgi:hypothetical protein
MTKKKEGIRLPRGRAGTGIDWVGSAGDSNILADRIRSYWAGRGWGVNVRVEKVSKRMGRWGQDPAEFWIIKSDMVNGLPQKRYQELLKGE